jgi:hypothetical protein
MRPILWDTALDRGTIALPAGARLLIPIIIFDFGDNFIYNCFSYTP